MKSPEVSDKDKASIMKDRTNYFSSEQVERMLDKAEKIQEKFLILLLWRTGRRVSELLTIKKKHIDFDNNLILFRILKKRKKTTKKWFAVDDRTINTLKHYLDEYNFKDDEYIFISNKKNKEGVRSHYTRKWAFETVKRLADLADIRFKEGSKEFNMCMRRGEYLTMHAGWHPHHFRHSFSINFLKKAESPTALVMLQQQLDHSDINKTKQYLQFSQKDRIELLNKVFRK